MADGRPRGGSKGRAGSEAEGRGGKRAEQAEDVAPWVNGREHGASVTCRAALGVRWRQVGMGDGKQERARERKRERKKKLAVLLWEDARLSTK